MIKNRHSSPCLGVTLLEILLVLAISASIIVTSVRYYGSASASLQTNTTLEQIQAITATIDNYSAGLSYTAINTALIHTLLPKNSLTTPWGTAIHLERIKPNSYDLTLKEVPTTVCPLLISKLATNNHFQIKSHCQTTASDLTYTYLANA